MESLTIMEDAAVAQSEPMSHSSADEEAPWETVPGAPVHLEWMDRAFAAVHDGVNAAFEHPELLSRAHLAKDQLAVVQKYTRICERFEAYSAKLLTKQRPLVPVRFPVKPLPNTRVAINECLGRSYANFVRRVHEQTLSLAPHRLAHTTSSDMAEVVEFVQTMAGALWSESRRVIDEESSEHEARTRMVRRCARFAKQCHDHTASASGRCATTATPHGARRVPEQARLEQAAARQRARAAGARQGARGRAVVRRGRGVWHRVVAAGRPRSAERVSTRQRRRQLLALERAPRRSGGPRALGRRRLGERALRSLAHLAAPLRSAKPSATPSTRCRAGRGAPLLVLARRRARHARGASHGCARAAASAGAWPRSRADGASRPPTSTSSTAAAPSSRAGLARVLAQLLQEGHLFLHRLGCDFANRIATCEYAKYELYIMRIESDTLVPFGELVGVPYQSRIPNLKEARLAQKRPLPLGAPAG